MSRFQPAQRIRLVAVGLMMAVILTGGCRTMSPAAAVGSRPLLGSPGAVAPPDSGRVYRKGELRRLFPGIKLGDERYAEVNHAWLAGWYETFRVELFRLGVVRWDERFQCNRFAEVYASLAQVAFYRQNLQTRSQAQALAIGPFWYVTEAGVAHAVVQALTDQGVVHIDPQTGRQLQLTPRERSSVFLQLF